MGSPVDVLKKGGIGVYPTDTLYGIVGSAFSSPAVERLYSVRKRDLDKPFIVLIASFEDLEKFDVALTEVMRKECEKSWPGPVSIILPVASEKYKYLHRGTQTIAFRMPKNEKLLTLLQEVGPLCAPSANTQGNPPATTIEEAKNYFGDSVDFYEDGGTLAGAPSRLIAFEGDSVKILRQ